jgi:hypothetical protein
MPSRRKLNIDARFTASGRRGHPRSHERYLIIHIFDHAGQLEAPAPQLAHQTSHGRLCLDQVGSSGIDIRLLDSDLHLIRLGIEFYKDVARFDPVIVVDQYSSHLTDHARRDEGHVTVHIGASVETLFNSWIIRGIPTKISTTARITPRISGHQVDGDV